MGAKWTADDIPNQAGRDVIVTGANSGLGFHTTLELARKGAHVVMACRNLEKGAEAERRIREEVPAADVAVRSLDLADLDSVRAFAEELDLDKVDLLINNAGVMALPRQHTPQGFERQLGTNHLGHYALTGLLMPKLLKAGDPRVVTVSSNAHKMGRVNFDNLNGDSRYFRWSAYAQSKLANLLFMFELGRRSKAAVTSVAAHPGYAATQLQFQAAEATGNPLDRFVNKIANDVLAQSDAMGALPSLFAATADIPSGSYVGPDGLGEFRGHPHLVTPTSRAQSEADAKRLWDVSEKLTGVKYSFKRARATA